MSHLLLQPICLDKVLLTQEEKLYSVSSSQGSSGTFSSSCSVSTKERRSNVFCFGTIQVVIGMVCGLLRVKKVFRIVDEDYECKVDVKKKVNEVVSF
jgi:hypothetical protein